MDKFLICVSNMSKKEDNRVRKECMIQYTSFFMFPAELASLKQQNQSQKTYRIDEVKRKQEEKVVYSLFVVVLGEHRWVWACFAVLPLFFFFFLTTQYKVH